MIYLIKFIDNNAKFAIYTGENTHGIYSYLEIFLAQTNFTSSDQLSHHFGTSYYTQNDTSTL